MQEKRPTTLEKRYTVRDDDLNRLEVLYGGRLVAIMDSLAARAARIHSGRTCVTASMDSIHFLAPVFLDETLLIKIAVNRAWTSSMEVGVKVLVERNDKLVHIASAYLTFVALDEKGRPTPVPAVLPQTADEWRRYKKAEMRRAIRLKNRPRPKEE